MYVRNLLSAGDLLTVVPIGIPITLQYDQTGSIQSVFRGFDDCNDNISNEILPTIVKSQLVPKVVPIKNGLTWVRGVLYTDKRFGSQGILPDSIYPQLIDYLIHNPDKFVFYAGNVTSLASRFSSPLSIRAWLNMSKFNILPSYLVPANIDRTTFISMVNKPSYPFKFPLIMYYMIQRSGKWTYKSTGLHQSVIKSISTLVDSTGCIKAKLRLVDFEEPLVVNYSEVLKYNLNTNSLIVFDCYNSIIYAEPMDSKVREPRPSKLVCSSCGKVIQCSDSGLTMCSDEHCTSRMYPIVNHFLSSLNLPEMTHNRYVEVTKKIGKVFSLPDLFTLPEYEDVNIHITLSKLMRALVPVEYIHDDSFFTAFSNRCKNSISALEYYIHNLDKAAVDLGLSGVDYVAFCNWMKDSRNAFDLDTFLHDSHLKIDAVLKRFDGPPIFRGKHIYLTGTFTHGSYEDVAAILQSYSAMITPDFDLDTNCVIIGDDNNGTNGMVVNQAKNVGIPVFGESDFFAKYMIDDDLTKIL